MSADEISSPRENEFNFSIISFVVKNPSMLPRIRLEISVSTEED